MATTNVTLSADYSDSGITAPKDLNLYNASRHPIEFAVQTSLPAVNFTGMRLQGGEKSTCKLANGEKLWARLLPRSGMPSAGTLVIDEVP